MQKSTLKRLTALALAGALCLSLAACGNGGNNAAQNSGEAAELKIVLSSHASWPYQENWPIWQWIEDATNTKLSIQAIPGEDFGTKFPLLLASSDTLPDLFHIPAISSFNEYATSGAFVPISDSTDKLPNYTKFMDSLSETERTELTAQRTAGDGKMYMPPVYGTQTVMNLRTWMYRKDIFEKNNLQVPTTETELYNVSKQLKKLYPKSYPLCFRNGLEQINNMGPMWKNDFAWNLYYDFKAEKWCWGAQDTETMTHIMDFFGKMQSEGLIPADFLTITSKSWEELVSTDRGFVMPEYLVRIDFFNEIGRKTNKDYTWAVMAPPKGDGANGQSKMIKLNMDPSGYVVCNTGNQAKIDKALSFLDWFYSDEGTELVSWGKKDISYKVDDKGEKSFILNGDETVQAKYGIDSLGAYQRTTTFEESYSKEQSAQGKLAASYTEDKINPVAWLALNEEEAKVKTELLDSLISYTEENLSKFILKQQPMSQWDTFQKGLKDMGVDRLMEAYTSAYNRAMGK